MTTGEKIFMWFAIFIIALIIIYFIGVAQWGWKNIFAPKPPIITQTDAEKCTQANKSKKDGEVCSNCVPEGSGMPNYNGVIKDGICVAKPEATPAPAIKKYVVSNQKGATIYSLQQGTFVPPRIPNVVPYGTQITILAIHQNQQFANTAYGWLKLTDIGIVN